MPEDVLASGLRFLIWEDKSAAFVVCDYLMLSGKDLCNYSTKFLPSVSYSLSSDNGSLPVSILDLDLDGVSTNPWIP